MKRYARIKKGDTVKNKKTNEKCFVLVGHHAVMSLDAMFISTKKINLDDDVYFGLVLKKEVAPVRMLLIEKTIGYLQ